MGEVTGCVNTSHTGLTHNVHRDGSFTLRSNKQLVGPRGRFSNFSAIGAFQDWPRTGGLLVKWRILVCQLSC